MIDSGSTDNTLDILATFLDVKLVQISAEEFHHAKTRNRGARIAQGQYLVFLNHDAWPIDSSWLDKLVAPLLSQKNAGIFSRHIPHQGCRIAVARDITNVMSKLRRGQSKPRHKLEELEIFFSTVSAAIRKDVFVQYPFSEDVAIAEDQAWSKVVQAAGFLVVYQPDSVVAHSHNYTFSQSFVFARDCRRVWQKIIDQKNLRVLSIIYYLALFSYRLLGDIVAIVMTRKINFSVKIFEISYAFQYRVALILGNVVGLVGK